MNLNGFHWPTGKNLCQCEPLKTVGPWWISLAHREEIPPVDVPGRASSPSPSPTRPDPPLGPGSGPPFLPDPESGLRKIVRYGLGSHLSYLEAFDADITFLSSDPSPTRPWVAVLRPDPSPGFQARPDPNNTSYDPTTPSEVQRKSMENDGDCLGTRASEVQWSPAAATGWCAVRH
ncbi:hypothetical protein B0H11DRAFT_1922103 [Mycena galericulata]|nr:hypothetical protein B0H11DRAFT_1922103 [Mycena galericulata]